MSDMPLHKLSKIKDMKVHSQLIVLTFVNMFVYEDGVLDKALAQ